MNLQAGRDIVVNNGNSIALYSIEEVAKQLLGSVFGELPDETKKQIETNQKSYFQSLSENLSKIIKQNEELKTVINSPDFQYVSKQATISASRSSSIELHKNLSLLLIQRVNNDSEDLKRIVYNEAIKTLAKLTQNQLKILTLCFLVKRTKLNGLTNFNQFIQYLEERIKPFIDFKKTNAEFEHLAYAGCASISIAGHDLFGLFKGNYPEIFKESDNIDELFKDKETATKLLTVWKETPIMNMNLTSVGIVLASTFYEQTTGDKMNIDIWIN
ncbi:MAG: hypothetical protein UV19_C0014G0012 [Parcubacteria group bacterium GW2011_GWA2_42_28]|nr:MAG: hypothetical protein UV19_C0014G0012 [Parcubacteria group bacterium GW2011_GWA2_42_28]